MNTIKSFSFPFLLLFSILPSVSAAQTISGFVFDDRNSNGRQERCEAGIGGVCVSDGEQVTVTDRHGRFVIDRRGHDTVFPILPSGYTIAGNNITMAAFNEMAATPESGVIYFPLIRQAVKNDFRIAAVGDIQVASGEELSFAAGSVFSELASRDDIDFCLFPGDLVYNRTELLEGMRDAIAGIPTKSWCVPGNHDRERLHDGNWGVPTYRNLFGAGDYAFNFGQVCFIGINNICPTEGEKFRGLVSERQKRFIGNVLRYVPEGNAVVLIMHIPLY
jgi:3',5'-cyclic AMP phosphodiesterase CpdA